MTAIEHPLVSVVDDDESVRESLPVLLRQVGFQTRSFSSAEEFLASDCIRETRCLILDIAMPGMSGPELHRELKRLGQEIPTIFITGEKDETIRARLLKQGAHGFLSKPINVEKLVATVKTTLAADDPAKIGNKIHNDKGKRSG
jgi:FixJ family two-component response regulator